MSRNPVAISSRSVCSAPGVVTVRHLHGGPRDLSERRRAERLEARPGEILEGEGVGERKGPPTLCHVGPLGAVARRLELGVRGVFSGLPQSGLFRFGESRTRERLMSSAATRSEKGSGKLGVGEPRVRRTVVVGSASIGSGAPR